MEQDFIYISKDYHQVFTIKTDIIDDKLFNNTFNQTIKKITKEKNNSKKFKIVNLYNASDKKYKIDRKLIGGGGGGNNYNDDFQTSWSNLTNYIHDNIENKINNNYVTDLYNQVLISGNNYGIPKDEIKKMFFNLLNSTKYQQSGGFNNSISVFGINDKNIAIGNENDQFENYQLPNEQPVDQLVIEQPLDQLVIEQPLDQLVIEQPVDQLVIEQPVDQLVIEQPVDQLVIEQPIEKLPTYHQPIEQLPLLKHQPIEQLPNDQQYDDNYKKLIEISGKNVNNNLSCPVQ